MGIDSYREYWVSMDRKLASIPSISYSLVLMSVTAVTMVTREYIVGVS